MAAVALASIDARPVPAMFDRVRDERAVDVPAREALLDLAMGAGRRRKSSETIRRGRLPAEGLALVACDDTGALAGTVRLWHVAAGVSGDAAVPALLLGPLAVRPDLAGFGIGTRLMDEALLRAAALGHRAVLLVGDPSYYVRFGFQAEPAAGLAMPGPFERHRLLARELVPGALSGATGLIVPTGRLIRRSVSRRAVA